MLFFFFFGGGGLSGGGGVGGVRVDVIEELKFLGKFTPKKILGGGGGSGRQGLTLTFQGKESVGLLTCEIEESHQKLT